MEHEQAVKYRARTSSSIRREARIMILFAIATELWPILSCFPLLVKMNVLWSNNIART